jgi:hypothetical protein
MTTYLLFAGRHYYPSGGVGDFVAKVEATDLIEARTKALATLQQPEPRPDWKEPEDEDDYLQYEWYQLADPKTLLQLDAGSVLRGESWGDPVAALAPYASL